MRQNNLLKKRFNDKNKCATFLLMSYVEKNYSEILIGNVTLLSLLNNS